MLIANPGIRYGIYGGVAVVLLFLLAYSVEPALFFNLGLQYGSLVLYLMMMYQAAKEEKAEKGIERPFRDMIRTPFLVFLLINLFYWLFYYALHLFDKGLVLTEFTMELNNLKAQLEGGLGDPQQANLFRERIAELEKLMQAPPAQPLGPIVTRMFVGALGGFGLAAGLVAWLRNQN